jgi:hypothetical protein
MKKLTSLLLCVCLFSISDIFADNQTVTNSPQHEVLLGDMNDNSPGAEQYQPKLSQHLNSSKNKTLFQMIMKSIKFKLKRKKIIIVEWDLECLMDHLCIKFTYTRLTNKNLTRL